jgi:hypothetical protein
MSADGVAGTLPTVLNEEELLTELNCCRDWVGTTDILTCQVYRPGTACVHMTRLVVLTLFLAVLECRHGIFFMRPQGAAMWKCS